MTAADETASKAAPRRSARELSGRARQRLDAWLERFSKFARGYELDERAFGRVLVDDPSSAGEIVIARIRKQRSPSPFAAFADPKRAASLVASREPSVAEAIVRRADRAVSDRFDIFGWLGLSYGDPVDWQRDPIRNRQAPLVHWSRVPFLDVQRVGDHKLTWELNRHQHLVVLAQAYALTDDERYAATIIRHVMGWMDANPPKLGINWSSSLELAFRAISWTWALHLARDSAAMNGAFVSRMLKFLHVHARHIIAHLSTYFSPNTHLTGEALGLLYLGTCFPEFREANEWRELGWSILERELFKQVLDDGVYFEQSTWYQRYTVDFYLHALQLRRAVGAESSAAFRDRLNRAVDPLVYFIRPDGTTPLIGDDDGGSLLPLLPAAPSDFRATLAHAAVLLGRPDCAALGREAATVLPWLVGAEGLATFHDLPTRFPAETARMFPVGGYFSARSSWSPDSDYLLVDCGPHGALSYGHSHSDALSLELVVDGRPLLVDPGTFSYVPPDRDRYRTTSAHNAITVDGQPSAVPGRQFRWNSIAQCTTLRTEASPRFAFFQGEHDGFMRLADPARVKRTLFAIFGRLTVVVDRIDAKLEHRVEGRLHLHPRLQLTGTAGASVLTAIDVRGGARPVDIAALGPGSSVRAEAGLVSSTYGSSTESAIAVYSTTVQAPGEVWALIVSRDDSDAMTVDEWRQEGTRGAFLQTARWHDALLAGTNGISADGIESDASWLWLRRPAAGRPPTEFVLVDASRLTVDGQPLFSVANRRGYISGRAGHSGWDFDIGSHAE